jgi:Chalcone isomerase-like
MFPKGRLNMAKHFSVWFLALGLCFAATGWSAEKKGIKMPDQVSDQGRQLVLNGLGVRKAYGVVSVYVGGLYLEKPGHDADAIVRSKEQKRLVLHFLMDVDQGKIRDAWDEGLAKNCIADCKAFAFEMKMLNGWMANMRNNDELIFALSADSVSVTVSGVEKGTIRKDGFPQQFLAIFVGPNPPNKGLKDGLLGLER